MKKVIKKNYKFILGVIIGLIWSSGIAYAATILFESSEVSYDNTTSGLSATNVQSALDELYVESTTYQLFESRVSSIESKLYPVGSYYETSDSSLNPNTSFGGTWASTTIKDDYIVEEGTSGIWTYRKWNSGIAECWGIRSNINESISTTWGNLYTGITRDATYPTNLFIEKPVILRQHETSDGWITFLTEYSAGTKDKTPMSVLARTSTANSINTSYYHYAIGLWKTYTTPSTIYRWHRTA